MEFSLYKRECKKFACFLKEQSGTGAFRGILNEGEAAKCISAVENMGTNRPLKISDLKFQGGEQNRVQNTWDRIYLNVNYEYVQCLDNQIRDNIKSFGNNAILDLSVYSGSDNEMQVHWHFDKHLRSSGDNPAHLLHPEYHFSFGGRKMDNLDCGNLLKLGAPRLMHPPLDFILAVDFVLSNFYGKRVSNLLDSRIYKQCVFNARKIFWGKYFVALAYHFMEEKKSNFFNPNNFEVEPDYAEKLQGLK